MGEVTTRTTGLAPALQSPELHRLTAVLRNKIEVDGTTTTGQDRCSISSLNAPTDAQRAALSRRRSELADALAHRPADRADKADAILEMFYCWSDTRRMDPKKLDSTAAKYVAVVDDLPLWAIVNACEQVARQDLAWPPSPGEVRAAALRLMRGPQDEFADVRRILEATIYTPTERGADAVDRVREAAAALRIGAAAQPDQRRREDEPRHAYFDERDAKRDEAAKRMPPLSREAADKLAESGHIRRRHEDAA